MPEKEEGLPQHIRVSIGTATVIGLIEGKLDAKPTTAYLMTYKEGKCNANCGFCPQARTSQSKAELLSRITWPAFATAQVISALRTVAEEGKIKRVCFQALNYPGVFQDLEALVKEIRKQSAVPISVSCQPLTKKNIALLANAGVNRIGIALDAATEDLFSKIKGAQAGSNYSWTRLFTQLADATEVFGKGNVSTHLIVGLGETEKEAAYAVQRCVDMSVLPALFAFTPIKGTTLENHPPPKIEFYRRVQLTRYLIVKGLISFKALSFDAQGKITGFGLPKEQLKKIVWEGAPFATSGCPDCNRPFYNEKPSGPFYNYPSGISVGEKEKIKQQLGLTD